LISGAYEQEVPTRAPEFVPAADGVSQSDTRQRPKIMRIAVRAGGADRGVQLSWMASRVYDFALQDSHQGAFTYVDH
jgi:hypothetical protein